MGLAKESSMIDAGFVLWFVLRTCLQSGDAHKGKSGKAGNTETLSHKQLRSTYDKHL